MTTGIQINAIKMVPKLLYKTVFNQTAYKLKAFGLLHHTSKRVRTQFRMSTLFFINSKYLIFFMYELQVETVNCPKILVQERMCVSLCIRPVMDWPSIQGVSLFLARDAGIGSSIPT